MDANTIMQMVGSMGFPIVACLGMAWFVKTNLDKTNERFDKIQTEHKEEIAKVTEALNNNTLAIQKLSDKLTNN